MQTFTVPFKRAQQVGTWGRIWSRVSRRMLWTIASQEIRAVLWFVKTERAAAAVFMSTTSALIFITINSATSSSRSASRRSPRRQFVQLQAWVSPVTSSVSRNYSVLVLYLNLELWLLLGAREWAQKVWRCKELKSGLMTLDISYCFCPVSVTAEKV